MEYSYEMISQEEKLPVRAVIRRIGQGDTHWHNRFEFMLVLKGRIRVKVWKEELFLKQHDFILINEGEIHRVTPVEEDNLVLILQIDPAFIVDIYPNVREVYVVCNTVVQSQPEHFDTIRSRTAQIVWELNHRSPGYQARVVGHIFFLAALLVSNFPCRNKRDLGYATNEGDINRLQRIIRYVQGNLDKKITLRDLCQHEHLNYYYLSHFIKNKMGTTFQEFLNQARLKKATDLLSHTSANISNIAGQVGFSSPISFHKLFKEKFGQSPTEYRKQHQSKSSKPKAYLHDPWPEEEGEASLERRAEQGLSKEIDREAALNLLFRYLQMKDHYEQNSWHAKKQIRSTLAGGGQQYRNTARSRLGGFQNPLEGLNDLWQKQFHEAQAWMGVPLVDMPNLFSGEMMTYQMSLFGKESYYWSYLEELLDAVLKQGARPFIRVAYPPDPAAVPQEKWLTLLHRFAVHCLNRYGSQELGKWYFEIHVSALPLLEKDEWEYFQFYSDTARAMKAVIPGLKVGGPGWGGLTRDMCCSLDRFLSHCQERDVPVDFLSLGVELGPFDLNGRSMAEVTAASSLRREILAVIREGYRKKMGRAAEIHGTAVFTSLPGDWWRPSGGLNRALLTKVLLELMTEVDTFQYAGLTVLQQEVQLQQPCAPGVTLFRQRGLKTGIFYFEYLFRKLGEEILLQGDDHIVTRNEKGEVQIMLFHAKVEQETMSLLFDLEIEEMKGCYQEIRYQLSHKPVSEHQKQAEDGEELTEEEVRYLNHRSYPEFFTQTVELAGRYRREVTVPPWSLELILLKKLVK